MCVLPGKALELPCGLTSGVAGLLDFGLAVQHQVPDHQKVFAVTPDLFFLSCSQTRPESGLVMLDESNRLRSDHKLKSSDYFTKVKNVQMFTDYHPAATISKFQTYLL